VPNIPDGVNSQPGSSQFVDPAETVLPAIKPVHENQHGARHSKQDSNEEGARKGRASRRSLRKKIITPLVLAAIGVLLFLIGIALYPSEGQLPTPPYATLSLKATFPAQDILYGVRQVSPSTTEITAGVELPAGSALPSAKTATAHLLVSLPVGISFRSCPNAPAEEPTYSASYCVQYDGIQTWIQPLKFKMERNPFSSFGIAAAHFYIRARSFGETFNKVNASAAIPAVNYQAPGTPVLETQYELPSASSYDWSAFPAQFANDAYAQWNEPLTSAGISGRAAVGINHANQASDDNDTFLAGALIGLAGGALLSAVQEALHASD